MIVHVLLNPVGAGGRALRRWRALAPGIRSLFPELRLITSRQAGDLRAEACRIATTGEIGWVIAAGGDGTSHEVVNGLMDGPVGHRASIGWLPIGSGNDLARAVGAPRGARWIEAHRHPTIETIDVGRIRYRDLDGRPATRAFGNSFTIGLSADVVRRSAGSGKELGGRLSYFLATLGALAGYRPVGLTLTVDGVRIDTGPSHLVSITNGPTFGAGMLITPGARLDDGAMDLVWVGGLSRVETVSLFPRIYWGGHLGHPKVHRIPVRRMTVDGSGPLAFETDGEPGQALLPLDVEVVPGGLSIVRPHPG